jgi:hypothetical protein
MRDELTPINTASRIVNFKLRSATTGQLLTGKVAGDFTGTRHVAGGTSTALSFSAGTAGDAYSSGKICPIGNGTYDWHVPDAMFTTLGQSNAVISCSGALDVAFDFQVVTPIRSTAAFGANTTAPDNASIAAILEDTGTTLPAAITAIWSAGTRTLTAISDSAGITTLLSRITALLQTKAEADTDQAATITAIGNVTATVDTGEIVQGILDAGVSIQVSSPYDPTEQTLTIVQRADYVDADVSRPLRFTIEKDGVAAGDAVRFGAKLFRGATLLASLVKTGTIVASGEDLVA